MAFRDLPDNYKLRAWSAKADHGGFIISLKEENTWCDILADYRSQIKYSPTSSVLSGSDGQWRRWYIILGAHFNNIF